MAKKTKAQAGGVLFEQQATNELLTFLTRLPELDEVLRQAGVQRHKLRVLLSDDEIYQAVETRFDAVNGAAFMLEPSEGAEADFLFSQLGQHLNALSVAAFDARLFGYSVAELVADYDDVGRIVARWVGAKPMQWFEPKPDGELRYFPNNGRGGVEGVPVDQVNKFCLIRNKASYEFPHGEALLSRLYWPWFFRSAGWKFWAKFLERFGSPVLVGETEGETTDMCDALLAAHGSAVLAISKGDKVTAIGSTGSNSTAFEAFEAALLRRIQKVILGQTLTSGTDGGSGNRALGDVHNDVRIDKRNSDLKMITQAAQWFIDVLCRLNGFKRHVFSFVTDAGLGVERAGRDELLYKIGVRFNRSYFEDNYNLSAAAFELGDAGQAPTKPAIQAAKAPAFMFAKDGDLTPQQAEVDALADEVLARESLPIDPAAIVAAIEAATDEADLADRLAALVEASAGNNQFSDDMAGALFFAEVMGYVHAARGL